MTGGDTGGKGPGNVSEGSIEQECRFQGSGRTGTGKIGAMLSISCERIEHRRAHQHNMNTQHTQLRHIAFRANMPEGPTATQAAESSISPPNVRTCAEGIMGERGIALH